MFSLQSAYAHLDYQAIQNYRYDGMTDGEMDVIKIPIDLIIVIALVFLAYYLQAYLPISNLIVSCLAIAAYNWSWSDFFSNYTHQSSCCSVRNSHNKYFFWFSAHFRKFRGGGWPNRKVPYSIHTILEELADGSFSISIDSFNHKTTKLFPLVLRYFHSKKGIQVRLLDLEELGGETATEVQNYFWQSFLLPIKIITLQIYEWILKILQRHKLKFEALTSFCADNCNTNFGGMDHSGDKNIFHK